MPIMKREYGGIQPCWRVWLFRIRIPFIHFNIAIPEVVTGLMNACTSYGALAVLIETLGLTPDIAFALVVFETMCYTLNWLLGEPSICGWITPAMAIIVLYLETLPEGIERIQALTCIQLELGCLFIILGAFGLSKKLNTLVPPAMKSGIVLGAGINAVVARLAEGGATDTQTIACICGIFVVCLLMFSQRIRKHMQTNKVLAFFGNYSFLWAVIVLFVVGGFTGEFQYEFSGAILKAPDWPAMWAQCSPFFIGWGGPSLWLMGLPYALTAWIISYGDFITVQELGISSARDDEHIEFDANRTNVICGIRNVILSLFAPYPALAGPLSAPYCIATYARYKESGPNGMKSIYDGSGTNLIFTVLGLFIYPLYELSLAASAALLVCVLICQGWVCAQIAFKMVRDEHDTGISGMTAGLFVARAAYIALPAAIVLYLVVCDGQKIREDYAWNKERQRKEDEETARQLEALEARLKSGAREEA